MTKDDKIKEAWGDAYEEKLANLDENGWFKLDDERDRIKYNCSVNGEWCCKGWQPFATGSAVQEIFIRPRELNGVEDNNGWKPCPLKDFLKEGFYLIRLYVPETNVEKYIVHEVKENDSGMLGYLYATHFKKIYIDCTPPLY